ncbi:hypothetical protein [Francisella sp. SYW-9]|uniref:hypothetical protein n=1 Tax=Francisella sp. SYW-9 TaxID=2610888 RepID=UPI00123DD3B6|nr:hypothetical protein [Francisella sp. SYW-9]
MKIIKGVLKLIWHFKKIFLIIVIFISVLGSYEYREYKKYNLAKSSCENLYLSKMNDFFSSTRVTYLDALFTKRPIKLSEAKNIYTLEWDKTINVAGQLDSFKCLYNFALIKH